MFQKGLVVTSRLAALSISAPNAVHGGRETPHLFVGFVIVLLDSEIQVAVLGIEARSVCTAHQRTVVVVAAAKLDPCCRGSDELSAGGEESSHGPGEILSEHSATYQCSRSNR